MFKLSLNNLLYVLAFFFPAVILHEILVYGSFIPEHDYWDNFVRMLSGGDGRLDLFSLQNEHIQAIPRLAYWANMHIFHGHDIPLKISIYIVTLLQVYMCNKVLRETFECQFKRALCFFIIASYSFTPFAMNNFIAGMSGTVWIYTNFFSILAFYCFYNRKKHFAYKLGLVTACICAPLCHSTGYFILPSIVVAYFLLYRPSLMLSLVSLFFALLLFVFYYLFIYDETANAGGLLLQSNGAVVAVIFLTFVMSGMAVGSVILSVPVASFVFYSIIKNIMYFWKSTDVKEKEKYLFWFAIAVYSGVFILSIGVTRYEFYKSLYISISRYQTLPALFLISAFILYIRQKEVDEKFKKIISTVAVCLVIVTYTQSYKTQIEYYRVAQENNDLNSYSLLLGDFFVNNLYNRDYFINVMPQRKSLVDEGGPKYLKQYNNIPYNEKYWNKCEKAISVGINKDNISVNTNKVDAVFYNSVEDDFHIDYLELIAQVPDDLNPKTWECILLLNDEKKIIGGGNKLKYIPESKWESDFPRDKLWKGFIPKHDYRNSQYILMVAFKSGSDKLTEYKLSIDESTLPEDDRK